MKVRIQDDLYQAVNGEWIEHAVIPDDRPTAGGFAELNEGVEQTLRKDFADFASGKKEIPSPEVGEAIKLYSLYLDADKRNKEGIAPVLPSLEKIASVKDVDDLGLKAKEFELLGIPLPFNAGVGEDNMDATKHCFVLLGPSIILPDTTYYQEGNEAGKQLLALYSSMLSSLLKLTPLSEAEQKTYLEDTLAFDALVAKQVKSQVEWSNYVNNYNPTPIEEVASSMNPFPFKAYLASIYGEKAPSTIIVYDPKAIKNFSSYFNKDTFALYIHWAYTRLLCSGAKLCSEQQHTLATSFSRAMVGIEKDPVLEKQAYRYASGLFSDPVGIYYGQTYFGEEAKKDVVSMVKKIIETYKQRMAENTFLAPATKEKAILKLSTIEIKMGYPDKADEFYSKLKVDSSLSLYQNATILQGQLTQRNWDKLYEEVNRQEWGMPGHMVNACYNPSMNDITFPAAILQKPFYGLDQSVEENLGGIGAVIGHEISHAFDNNGASFDEKGSLKNWWTPEDYASFKKLTQAMIDEFEGLPLCGGKVNGELTVSENIADNGGMGVTLAIMKTLDHPDYSKYFQNWAKVWCMKAKPQYIQYLLINDVHAPAEWRANMQPRNFEEWYLTFSVKEGDGMYLSPEKRVSIW